MFRQAVPIIRTNIPAAWAESVWVARSAEASMRPTAPAV